MRAARAETTEPARPSEDPEPSRPRASTLPTWSKGLDWRPALTTWTISRAAFLLLFVVLLVMRFRWHGSGTASVDQWDTHWYILIAQHGYFSAQSANFMPLFPAAMAAGGRILNLGQTPSQLALLTAGVLVANMATLVAMVGLHRLVSDEENRDVSATTLRLLVAYPGAFFLTVAYTEGPFLAASVLALLAARRQAWWKAALAALVASLLKPTAPVLVLPLAWEAVRQRRQGSGNTAASLAAVAAVPVGFAAYGAYLWHRFGDPLLFLHTQSLYWHHRYTAPWTTVWMAIRHLIHGHAGATALDLTAALAFLLVTVMMVRRLPLAYVLFTGALVAVILVSPQPQEADVIRSTVRYLSAAFPAFWLVARWTRRVPGSERALVLSGAAAQAVLALVFILGGPIY